MWPRRFQRASSLQPVHTVGFVESHRPTNAALQRGTVDGHMTLNGQSEVSERRAVFNARWRSAGRFLLLRYWGTMPDA